MMQCEKPEVERGEDGSVTYRQHAVYTEQLDKAFDRCNVDKALLLDWAEKQR